MNRSMFESRRSGKGSIAISLAVHVVVIALIASITFRYPLAAFFGIDKDLTPVERIQYVETSPRRSATAGAGGSGESETKRKPKKTVTPAPIVAPAVVPTIALWFTFAHVRLLRRPTRPHRNACFGARDSSDMDLR